MSDEVPDAKPKVVTLGGKPHTQESGTPQQVRDVHEWARQELDGEKQVAIGVVIVDHMGRVGTHYFWEAGFSHNIMSGAALLLRRMQDNYEKGVK